MKLKLCVIVTDATQAVSAGGGVEVRTHVFDLPERALAIIEEVYFSPYVSVTLGINEDNE